MISTDISHTSLNSRLEMNKWPELPRDESFYGLAGQYVRFIEPHTEADSIAILVQFLTAFGNIIGKTPHFRVEDDYHALKINVVLVGETGKGRKGTSWSRVRRPFEAISIEWVSQCIKSGLSSGEGIIWAVRDPVNEDSGVLDKRLLVVEPEFATVLRVNSRDGNTLSAIIRQAWDGDSLRILNKNSPTQATGAHLSIVGHITKDELLRYMNRTEMANGFGNRIIWICARRSKILPEGGHLTDSDFESFNIRMREVVSFASQVGELKRNKNASEYWASVYPSLSEGKPGMIGALLGRAEAYVMRFACIYALLDLSTVIGKEHLLAALALWEYSERSVRYIFGDCLGDPIADTILTALRSNPKGLTRTEISGLFKRHADSVQITNALKFLNELGFANSRIESTTGRSQEIWFAIAK